MTPAEQMKETMAERRRKAADGEIVQVRVLKKGDGKISAGDHDPSTFDNLYHVRGDIVSVPLASALLYEESGMAEMVADEPAKRGPGRPPNQAPAP